MTTMAPPPPRVAFQVQDQTQPQLGPRLSPDTASIASTPQTTTHPYRARGISNASAAESVSSVASAASFASTSSRASAKRQEEFERFFGNAIDKAFGPGEMPDDYLTLIETQSCDLQAKVLLHGRLYLTPHHLCFRSNILGYKTEKIHPLKGITSVRKGTTAKWIQNAVYVIEGNDEEDYVGYGSLGDRDAMYDNIIDNWKAEVPEVYSAWLEKGSVDTLVEEQATPGDDPDAPVEAGHDPNAGVTATKCTGEDHFDELAIDTTIPIPMEQLYNLVYHNQEFMEDFYKNDKGLTGKAVRRLGFAGMSLTADLQISDWAKEGGDDRRTLTYVMHMVSDCGDS